MLAMHILSPSPVWPISPGDCRFQFIASLLQHWRDRLRVFPCARALKDQPRDKSYAPGQGFKWSPDLRSAGELRKGAEYRGLGVRIKAQTIHMTLDPLLTAAVWLKDMLGSGVSLCLASQMLTTGTVTVVFKGFKSLAIVVLETHYSCFSFPPYGFLPSSGSFDYDFMFDCI